MNDQTNRLYLIRLSFAKGLGLIFPELRGIKIKWNDEMIINIPLDDFYEKD